MGASGTIGPTGGGPCFFIGHDKSETVVCRRARKPLSSFVASLLLLAGRAALCRSGLVRAPLVSVACSLLTIMRSCPLGSQALEKSAGGNAAQQPRVNQRELTRRRPSPEALRS